MLRYKSTTTYHFAVIVQTEKGEVLFFTSTTLSLFPVKAPMTTASAKQSSAPSLPHQQSLSMSTVLQRHPISPSLKFFSTFKTTLIH